ncbi:hypothetical protein MUP59_07785 [Candidatus Bathyarchaeota archaeon]|nr:hypothetical protein [Candidatus Bathyarchaeota archaeon]
MEKFYSQSERELGYPHEVILYALVRSETTIEQDYRTRVKLFANLLRIISRKNPAKVEVPEGADVTVRMLESLTTSDVFRKTYGDYLKKLQQLMEGYARNQSAPLWDSLREFVADGVFLHILARELGKDTLFSTEESGRILEVLDEADGVLGGLFGAVQLWESSSCDNVSSNIINSLSSSATEEFIEARMFLSYALAMRCPRSKPELLVGHYQLVRRAVGSLSNTINQDRLSDEVSERLFRVAVGLFLCGYLNSIRLPNEEGIRYVDEIIKDPSIEYIFGEVYDSVASVSIPKTVWTVPLWGLALTDVVLIILHWTVEIQRPYEISIGGFSMTIPAVPVFLLFVVVILLVLLWRLYDLKGSISKNLRRGNVK